MTVRRREDDGAPEGLRRVASRANLARITTVLEGVRAHPDLELQVIAAASALLERFGSALDVLEPDTACGPPAAR